LLAGEPFIQLESQRRRRDGRSIDVDIFMGPLRDASGNLNGIISVVADITERKRHQNELSRLHAELERRVEERTHALQVANRELASFSYSVSHDLRAPLRAINGFAAMLQETYGSQFDRQGRNYLDRVRKGTEKMAALIDDLLRLSQISRQEMRIKPVDLCALAREVAADLQAEDPGRQVEWIIVPGVQTMGDAGLLEAVMRNLMGNAWKYSSGCARASIEFGLTHRKGRPVYFVRDNGAGFDMAYAGKLFGAFQRLHTPDEFPGSGIGLAIVARIIHRHGGDVWAEGQVGEGATFYFRL
jgi:light-regulated signal transduction histidine kinase (bacteriophytochrome)